MGGGQSFFRLNLYLIIAVFFPTNDGFLFVLLVVIERAFLYRLAALLRFIGLGLLAVVPLRLGLF